MRFSNFVKWFLYKNMNFSFILLFYNMQNGFSGQTIYEDLYFALYDVNCTTFAILLYLICDQGIDMRHTNKEENIGHRLSHFY